MTSRPAAGLVLAGLLTLSLAQRIYRAFAEPTQSMTVPDVVLVALLAGLYINSSVRLLRRRALARGALIGPQALWPLRRNTSTNGQFIGWLDLNGLALLCHTILRPFPNSTKVPWVPLSDLPQVTQRVGLHGDLATRNPRTLTSEMNSGCRDD